MKAKAPRYAIADGRAEMSNEARAPGLNSVPSTMTAGRPTRTNRYHRKPTRHRTIRRSRLPTPAPPSVAPVTMNAATEGPSKLAGAIRRAIAGLTL